MNSVSTTLVPGSAWPDPTAGPWIRPKGYYSRPKVKVESSNESRAAKIRAWLSKHPWSTGTMIAEGTGLPASAVNRTMRTQVAYNKVDFETRHSPVSNRPTRYYRLRVPATTT